MDRKEDTLGPEAPGAGPSSSRLLAPPTRPPNLRRPSIRIRHSAASLTEEPIARTTSLNPEPVKRSDDDVVASRRRSSSEPQRPNFGNDGAAEYMPMTTVAEEGPSKYAQIEAGRGRWRSASASAMSSLRLAKARQEGVRNVNDGKEYDSRVVNLLDVVDPEVSTLTTLTNVQNSLFVPDLGRFVNRQPTYNLTRPRSDSVESVISAVSEEEEETSTSDTEEPPRAKRTETITSNLSVSRFAVLPEGTTLDGWDPSDKWEINDHVRHMLHSRRSKFKRGMKGFWQYVQKPLGFLVTLYATLITLFGLAWVLFLIGWIYVGDRQLYAINVIDNVLVALFAIVGDGLAPFRAIDTYHMIYIAYYHRLTWRLRRKQDLPKLKNPNDLPEAPLEDVIRSAAEENELDIEMAARDVMTNDKEAEYSVLTPEQQKKLTHHSNKFSKSHTFYKPHETTTHHAFPVRLLIAVVILLDFHSIFQITLGACTWGIDYRVRPTALTTTILCLSISCNIASGIVIMVGDRMTRKKEVIEKMLRQQLTQEAIKKVEKKKKKREKKRLEEKAASNCIHEEDEKEDKVETSVDIEKHKPLAG
ncbi:Integral membrane protein [Trichophyton interdigitale]|uniref:Integral membrane protein n=1 Tax=Trichophyton interdigitale TaxID=101480 RepID=A0A9P4YGW2_9EURO|nr:Integral membrane protein [Trichophyton interdigitale]KAF3894477.1 Integral membrane protein [Trichophyton interdigitale]KAG8208888.1 Integral membrane protein [Trichophyton interdigitale]